MYEVIQKNEYSSLTSRFHCVDSWDVVARDTFSFTQRARSLYSLFFRSFLLSLRRHLTMALADLFHLWLALAIRCFSWPRLLRRWTSHRIRVWLVRVEALGQSNFTLRMFLVRLQTKLSSHYKVQRLTWMCNVDLVLKALISATTIF